MKKLFLLAAAVSISFMLNIEAFADIEFSHHDFSRRGWSDGKICEPCHTPHNANTEVEDSPLWNHTLTSAVYALYTSPTLDAVPGQPNGKSKLCLSCHDGTVAVDSYGDNVGGSTFIGSAYSTGTDLAHEHPISITYNTALSVADGELHNPSTTLSGLGGTIEEDLLDNGRLECTSCHDPHISRNTQGCSGCHQMHGMMGLTTISLSLRKSNENSAFCLTCHSK